MKKYFRFTLLTLAAALLFTACSNEEDVTGGNASGTDGQLTFVFKGINGGATTYALNDVPASQIEKKVDDITIYMFAKESAAGLGDGLLKYTQSFTSLNNTSGSVTLNVSAPGLTGQYVVYFVANNSASQFIDMTDATVGGITEATFRNKATIAVASDIDPNLFLMTGQITTAIDAFGTHPVTLRRRVARFDLVNDNFGDLTITKLTITNAKDKANAFANRTVSTPTQLITPSAITSFTWADVNNASSVKIGESHESLFYLNPTYINSTNGGATKIYVEGIDKNSKSFIYELKAVNAFNIDANYRYKLIIDQLPNNEVTFSIAIVDWDSSASQNIATSPGNSILAPLSTPILSNATYDSNSSSVITTPGSIATIDLSLAASSSLGVDIQIVPQLGADLENWDATKIAVVSNVTAGLSTYAIPYFKSDVKLSVASITANKSFISIVRIKDRSSGQIYDLKVYYQNATALAEYYPGTSLKPVEFGGVTWAPVNVGASLLTYSQSTLPQSVGSYFQFGRNAAVSPVGDVDMILGPLSASAASATSKFIQVLGDASDIITLDWLDIQNNDLWSGSDAQGPCPSGWRVPTSDELNNIVTNYASGTKANGVWSIAGTNGETLHIPLAGYRNRDGKTAYQGQTGYYWSSTAPTGGLGQHAFKLDMGTTAKMAGDRRSMANALRCVKAS